MTTATHPAPADPDGPAADSRARIVFRITLHPGTEQQFLAAYESIRHLVAEGVPGHLVDQVCESADTPGEWLITSEWQRLEDFRAWERTPEHRELVRPMRACMASAASTKYLVRRETGNPGRVP
jgi:heme-degrading monooxygenase HmoA